jgi:hypothetical protein
MKTKLTATSGGARGMERNESILWQKVTGGKIVRNSLGAYTVVNYNGSCTDNTDTNIPPRLDLRA